MVELERGIERRVILDISMDVDEIRLLDESVWKDLPFPEQASFPDGRVGYFILTEAGFPYLAYALFSEDEPRDEKERSLLEIRSIWVNITTLLYKKPLRHYTFTYWRPLTYHLEDEMRRFIEWAEKLTLEDVKAMLDKLEELEKQQKPTPEIDYPSDEGCLKSIKNLAALLCWLLDERTKHSSILKIGVAPRIDEPGAD